MEIINRTNSYTMFKNKLNTNEEYRMVIANNITDSIEINIIFNENFAIIKPNKCYISLAGINIYKTNTKELDVEKIKIILRKTWEDLQKEFGIKNFKDRVNVIINNEVELEIANSLAENGIRITKEKGRELLQKERQKEELNKIIQVNTITKEDNGILKQYIERPSDNNTIGYMLEGITIEDMMKKLEEINKDPVTKQYYQNLNTEDLSKALLDAIAKEGTKKKYLLESAREQTATNQAGALAGNIADQNNGEVNQEIAVVKNDPSLTTTHNAVEEDGQEFKVVEPEVQATETSMNDKVSTTNTQPSNYGFKHQSNNDYGEPTQEENQELEQTDEIVQGRTNVYTKTRKLVKANKSSGIITLPIIIFILSGLLLIASAVIYILSR